MRFCLCGEENLLILDRPAAGRPTRRSEDDTSRWWKRSELGEASRSSSQVCTNLVNVSAAPRLKATRRTGTDASNAARRTQPAHRRGSDLDLPLGRRGGRDGGAGGRRTVEAGKRGGNGGSSGSVIGLCRYGACRNAYIHGSYRPSTLKLQTRMHPISEVADRPVRSFRFKRVKVV